MLSISSAPASARVWIYQSNRPFSATEITSLQIKVQAFAKHWVSHNNALRAWGEVLQKHFILLMVDESMAGASGCSIDKSVYFMQSLENEYGITLFDRLLFGL